MQCRFEEAAGPLPVIVWVHGVGWKDGKKDWRRTVPLVPKGDAVAIINYRPSQQAVFPAQVEDCKAAVRWLRANAQKYNLDRDHIGARDRRGLAPGSATGHVGLSVAGVPSRDEGTMRLTRAR